MFFQAFLESGDFESAMKIYEHINSTAFDDRTIIRKHQRMYIYSVLCNMYRKRQESQPILKIMASMTESGNPPDIVHYTTLLSVYSYRHDVDNTIRVAEKILQTVF